MIIILKIVFLGIFFMLQASMEWSWTADITRNRLLLDMSSTMQLCTPFKLRQLSDSALQGENFSLEHAHFYEQVSSYLSSFNLWSEAVVCQIALNATAARFLLKPTLAKSWFFNEYSGSVPSTEAIISLSSKSQTGQFLIVECGRDASLCMCLEDTFQLDANLCLGQYEVIKVLNDRIHPILIHQAQQKRA